MKRALVVSTLAVRLTCRLAPELPAEYRAKHEWGTAYGAHCLVLALDRPLTFRSAPTRRSFAKALRSSAIAKGVLKGVYERA